MTAFASLHTLGPVEPVSRSGTEPWTEHLGHYLDHYRLAPLLCEQVTLHAGFVETPEFRLWTQVWCPASPRGTAFVVHGYFDHLGLYRHLLELLLCQGWNVVLWDLPGHGLSSGARASINDFDDYGTCLEALKEALSRQGVTPHPWVGIGQSTGAAILATDALGHGEETRWAGLALLAPLVRPSGWPRSSWLHLLARPFIRTLPRKYRVNSSDDEFSLFLREKDPLQSEHLTLTWVGAMRRWMPRLMALPTSELPILILQGEQDLTVDWAWNLEVLGRKFPNAHIYRHPTARHHLVNEAEEIRQALFLELENYLLGIQVTHAAQAGVKERSAS
ncbi:MULTISPECIES: alpha/beta hydrolase [Halomonadaceae]|uniref:alpha/beta hydrolase n=1 Tax=Halomonadaceae TaxID=28256 RepID=UPI001599EA95|nr:MULTISPECIES: alpha/beta hydrolase [Halomonas]QJQ95482.1 alpha/beta hydrolase [Halomonas sp. PA5]